MYIFFSLFHSLSHMISLNEVLCCLNDTSCLVFSFVCVFVLYPMVHAYCVSDPLAIE
jgi:hypothetical protein